VFGHLSEASSSQKCPSRIDKSDREDTSARDAGSISRVSAHVAQTLGETQAQRALELLVEGRDGEEAEVLDSSIGCH